MKMYYITHNEEVRTGGEKYNSYMINTIAQKINDVKIFSDRNIPTPFKSNYLTYNIYYFIKFSKLNDACIIIDSYLHPRFLLVMLYLKIFTRTQIIGTVHHLYWQSQKSIFLKTLDRMIELFFIRMFDSLIVPSEYTYMRVRDIVGRMQFCKIIRPGFDAQYINKKKQYKINKKSDSMIRLLCVANVHERKGLEYLIQAVIRIDNVELNIIGDILKQKNYYQYLQKIITQNALSKKVIFRGFVDNNTLINYYLNSDVFVLPTLHEGYGIVLLEAMSFGIPIVATNVCSIPEIIINGYNGILVPPKNTESLVKAIKSIIESPKIREALIANGKRTVTKHNTWNDVKREWESFFIQVLN